MPYVNTQPSASKGQLVNSILQYGGVTVVVVVEYRLQQDPGGDGWLLEEIGEDGEHSGHVDLVAAAVDDEAGAIHCLPQAVEVGHPGRVGLEHGEDPVALVAAVGDGGRAVDLDVNYHILPHIK